MWWWLDVSSSPCLARPHIYNPQMGLARSSLFPLTTNTATRGGARKLCASSQAVVMGTPWKCARLGNEGVVLHQRMCTHLHPLVPNLTVIPHPPRRTPRHGVARASCASSGNRDTITTVMRSRRNKRWSSAQKMLRSRGLCGLASKDGSHGAPQSAPKSKRCSAGAQFSDVTCPPLGPNFNRACRIHPPTWSLGWAGVHNLASSKRRAIAIVHHRRSLPTKVRVRHTHPRRESRGHALREP